MYFCISGYPSCHRRSCDHRAWCCKCYDCDRSLYRTVLCPRYPKRYYYRKGIPLCRGRPFPWMQRQTNPLGTYFSGNHPVYYRQFYHAYRYSHPGRGIPELSGIRRKRYGSGLGFHAFTEPQLLKYSTAPGTVPRHPDLPHRTCIQSVR